MEVRSLRCFVALAEKLHLRRAPERQHTAHPPVRPISRQIRQLEHELGVRLFDRASHYVRLTGSGRLFFDEIRQGLIQLKRALEVAERTGRGEVGDVVASEPGWKLAACGGSGKSGRGLAGTVARSRSRRRALLQWSP
jgi:DNA-binding transcriptional LysR family regulator